MQRVVAILESVARSDGPITPGRVGEETQLSQSTVSRLMRELADEEMLDRSADGGHYSLGRRVFGMVAEASKRGDWALGVNRVLAELRDLTGETASLHVRRGDQRVCTASATSRHQLRRVIAIGDSTHLVGTVPGDVLMSQASEDEREALVSAVLFGHDRTRQLERMRFAAEKAYSVYGVESLGLVGIAVPVWAADEVASALTVSGPMTRFSVDVAEAWLPDLQAAARRLEPWMRRD